MSDTTPRAMRVRIGRLVLDRNVAPGSTASIGEAIQTELASLLSGGAGPRDDRGQAPTSLARTIAASISGRLDAMNVRSPSASRVSPASPHAARGTTHG